MVINELWLHESGRRGGQRRPEKRPHKASYTNKIFRHRYVIDICQLPKSIMFRPPTHGVKKFPKPSNSQQKSGVLYQFCNFDTNV